MRIRILDFKRTLEEARTLEMTEKELSRLKDNGTQIGANKVSLPGRGGSSGSGRRYPIKKNNTCRNCGEKFPHDPKAPCKAKNATCYKCNRQGHYGRMCPQSQPDRKKANEITVSDGSKETLEGDSNEEVDQLIDAMLIHVNAAESEVRSQVYPNTKMTAEIEGVPLELNVDSMADANILGSNHLQVLGDRVKLLQTAATIKPFGSPPIPTLGKFKANLSTQKGSTLAEFYVTQAEQPLALLGKFSAFDLGILKIDVAKVSKFPPVEHKPYS